MKKKEINESLKGNKIMATTDIKQLNDEEEQAYLSIVDGNDIVISNENKKAIIQQSNDKYDVCNLQNKNVIKSFKYPIDALNYAVKIIGNFESWQIAY